MENYKKEVSQSLVSCIISRQNGVPLSELNKDFKELTGYSIPYLSLGYPTLISYLTEFKNFYFIKNERNEDTIIADSENSNYMIKLIQKQRPSHKRKRISCGRESPDMNATYSSIPSTIDSYYSRSADIYNNNFSYNKRRKTSTYINKQSMEKLAPLLYGNQLLGDDIFLGMAEYYMMVNITKTAPKRCGLCIAGQTIQDLTENLKQQKFIPSQVIILIGLTDIINGKNIDDLKMDMKSLLYELKENDIKATICTIPQLSCVPKRCIGTLKKYNEFILMTENETDNISIFHLEVYHSWLHKMMQLSDIDKKLVAKEEYSIILNGLQDHINVTYEE